MTTHEDNLALVTRILDDLRGIQAAYSEPTAEVARRARSAVKALQQALRLSAPKPPRKRKSCAGKLINQAHRQALHQRLLARLGADKES